MNSSSPQSNEKDYGQHQQVTFYTPEGALEFSIGEKYPLPLPENVEGETLIFADSLLINMLWREISETEKNILRGPCDGLSIHQDFKNKIIILVFIFAGSPFILPIADDKEIVQEWASKKFDSLTAFFFLTEAADHNIQLIRNLSLPSDFVRILQPLLVGYQQPDLEQLQNRMVDVNADIAFKQAKYRWIYSTEEEGFVFVPMEIRI